jgi:type II secretory ATPase GspE/PulE/Tfp pilus assembly ATPase PilB-like protein
MLASALVGVIGQRLVRQVCRSCRTAYQPSDELMREFFDGTPTDLIFYKGSGCSECNHTGYHGRMSVAELWAPNEEDFLLINKGASFEDLRQSSLRTTLSMADDAFERLADGRTNLEELIRMLPYSAITEFRQRRLGGSEENRALLAS